MMTVFLISIMPSYLVTAGPNIEEIRSLIDRYAMADDGLDEEGLAAREKVWELGEDAIPSLQKLFLENENDFYRKAVVDAFRTNKRGLKVSVPFIKKQLAGDAKSWKGKIWVVAALDFLAEADADSVLEFASKAAESESPFIKYRAEELLAEFKEKKLRERRPRSRPGESEISRSSKTLDAPVEQGHSPKKVYPVGGKWLFGVLVAIVGGFCFFKILRGGKQA